MTQPNRTLENEFFAILHNPEQGDTVLARLITHHNKAIEQAITQYLDIVYGEPPVEAVLKQVISKEK